jgi:hypothetical protein
MIVVTSTNETVTMAVTARHDLPLLRAAADCDRGEAAR